MQPTLFSVRFLSGGVPVDMTTDAELLQQSRAGHREAFAGLVERYQNLVCAVTFGGTGDRALAADLAQETFVTAWTALPTLRDESRFRSWLCGIARNLVGKARRKSRPTEAAGELVDPRPDAEAQIEDLRSEALVREILDEMDDTFREPLVLFYWEGRSTKEVAAQLGLSVSAVEQRLSRGRRRIKAEVEARVDQALQSAKPDRKFSAMVLAAIEGIPAPAVEPSAVSKTALAAGLVAASAVGWFAWSSAAEEDPEPAPRTTLASAVATDDEVDEPEPLPAATKVQRPVVSRGPADADSSQAAPKTGTDMIGADLQLEQYPNRVLVNLLGGPTGLSEEKRRSLEEGFAVPFNKDGKITDAPTRRISGTVVGPEGEPVAGAVVVAGNHIGLGKLRGPAGRMQADAGHTTDASGRFSFDAPTGESLVTAVAHRLGFSDAVLVDGSDDVGDLELVLDGVATVEGTLAFEGEPVPGYVSIRSLMPQGEAYIDMIRPTDEGGHFETTGLPPGKYLVYAAAEMDDAHGWEGQQGPTDRVTLELSAGDTAHHDFEFSRGVTIEFRATRAGELGYYVFPGAQLDTWSEARVVLSDVESRSVIVGSTPDDEAAFAVIQGIPAEPLTVCAVRPHKLFEESSYTECKKLPKPTSDDATLQVTFDPPPE